MSDAERTSFEARIVLRPRSLDEILDLALAYLRASPWPFVKLALVLSALGLLPVVAAALLGADPTARWGVAILITPVLERAVTVFAGRHLFKHEPSLWASLVQPARRLPLELAFAGFVTLPATLALFSGFDDHTALGFALVLASFWPFLLAANVYLGEVMYLERLSFGRALKRTRALVAYRYGRALALLSVSGLARAFVALSAAFGFDFFFGFLLQFKEIEQLAGSWPALAGYFLGVPYLGLVRLFDYVDARTRREGWDIQVRFNAVAQRAQAEGERRIAA